jgi:glycosyltransferase involved in cell wall biosynthesis
MAAASVPAGRNGLRVLALMPYPIDRVAGQRFRIEQWAPLLRTAGVDVAFSPFLSPRVLDVLYSRGHVATKVSAVFRGYLRRLKDLAALEEFDVVYLYREAAWLGTAWIEMLAARRRPLVFDFDDAIYLTASSDANRAVAFLKSPRKVEDICRLATCVVVGNDILASFAQQHARRVEVIPTSIDTDKYRTIGRPANARPIVGWSGSGTTAPYLSRIADALRRLRRQHDFELRVIGESVQFDGLDVRCLPWRAATEVEDLASLDVGLMPLVDDEWSRGKCGLKALQYMALGIPPVVSPVGVNAAIVTDARNGFYARTDEEWVDRIGLLLRDADLRARMGAQARRTVDEQYSARVQAPRLAAVLSAAAGHERVPRLRA